jgi:hypothetical protein
VEEAASGRVSFVLRDIRARISFVPAFFKALAADPEALESACLQAPSYHDARAAQAAPRLAARNLVFVLPAASS